MNNILVYCEIEDNQVKDVSLELLTKGNKLAQQLNCELEAIVLGNNLKDIGQQVFPYGVNTLHIGNDERLAPYLTLPHAKIVQKVIEQQKPQIVLLGATSLGRDLAPRVCSSLGCGLTADCTNLEIGEHYDKRAKKEYKDILFQIRPAFGGSIIATIISPESRPQMATVREGVMKKEIYDLTHQGAVNELDPASYLAPEDEVIQVIERNIEKSGVNIKNSPIIISGGYGVGSKEGFDKLYELADVLGGDVGASRAAVDAGFAPHERQVGQTGVTVRPKLYIACGISGAVQHRAGMEESAIIISVNTDEEAPINTIADYHIHGDVNEVVPKMVKYYKKNSL